MRAYAATYHRVPSYYSEIAYTAAQFMLKGLKAVSGRIGDRKAFVAAVQRVELPDAPRGPVWFDAWGNPVENIYIRRVDIVNGQPRTRSSIRIHVSPNSGRSIHQSILQDRLIRTMFSLPTLSSRLVNDTEGAGSALSRGAWRRALFVRKSMRNGDP